MPATDALVTDRPDRLNRVDFRACDHPLRQVTPIQLGRSLTVQYCLTCGATCTGPTGWRGGFGVDHYINYDLIDSYGLRDSFDFWIRQRPKSRIFGDVS